MVMTLAKTDRSVAPPSPQSDRRFRLYPFTWEEALELTRLGIVPEDASTELLEGMIVVVDRAGLGEESAMANAAHVYTTETLSDLRSVINGPTRHVRSQSPLRCSLTHVPLPDFMVLRGRLGDYSDTPTAANALCVVEVADSSYERDAGMKLAAYARAGVPQYVIVNLRNLTAEVYATPDREAGTYGPATVVPAEGTLSLRVGDANEMFDLVMSDVLP